MEVEHDAVEQDRWVPVSPAYPHHPASNSYILQLYDVPTVTETSCVTCIQLYSKYDGLLYVLNCNSMMVCVGSPESLISVK